MTIMQYSSTAVCLQLMSILVSFLLYTGTAVVDGILATYYCCLFSCSLFVFPLGGGPTTPG